MWRQEQGRREVASGAAQANYYTGRTVKQYLCNNFFPYSGHISSLLLIHRNQEFTAAISTDNVLANTTP